MEFRKKNKALHWAKVALKCGLLLSDSELWASVNRDLRNTANAVGGRIRNTYEGKSRRLDDARIWAPRRTDWSLVALTAAAGVGVGIGVGLLLAPASGEEVRSNLRDKALSIKDRVNDVAGGAVSFRRSAPGVAGD